MNDRQFAGAENSSAALEANEAMPSFAPPEMTLARSPYTITPTQEALFEVHALQQNQQLTGAWPNISKTEFINDLVERIHNPRKLDQMSLNACGPAAFLLTLSMDDIVHFTKLAINLYTGGATDLNGSYISFDPDAVFDHFDGQIIPHDGLRDRRPGDSEWNSRRVNNVVDYILMASMRSDDTFGADIGEYVTGGDISQFEDPGDSWQGATFPASLKNWFEESGKYTDVRDITRLTHPRNADHMQNTLDGTFHQNGYRCHMLINAHMITVGIGDEPNLRSAKDDHTQPDEWGTYLQESIANHWIVYQGNLSRSGGQIAFDVWSWGQDMRISLPERQFNQMYFGAVVALPLR